MRSLILAAGLGVIVASAAFADIPAPRSERIEATHRFRFLGVDDHPDYVFFFGFHAASGRGNPFAEPARLMRVNEGQPVIASGHHLTGDHLLAIPRAEFDARKDDFAQQGPFMQMKGAFPGTLKCDVRAAVRSETAEYRIQVKDGKLTVELLSNPSIFTVPQTPPTPPASQAQAPADKASSLTPWTFPAVACVAFSIALALGGIWLAWRSRRTTVAVED